jgi:hypothetical protein
MPKPVTADTSTLCTSPPAVSSGIPAATSSPRTRVGSAPGTSHLVSATTYRHSAAMMCAAASRVCGITPSSAAHTSTATSVTAGAAFAHGAKRGVARRVQERESASRTQRHDERADVLRDPASLARGDRGGSQRVQQSGLAVVHVAHHRHHRAPRGIGACVFSVAVRLIDRALGGVRSSRRLSVRGLRPRVHHRNVLRAELDRHELDEVRGPHGVLV